MAVTPKGIVTPDASSPYNLITDLNTLASTTDAAIATQKGTASQRTAATAGASAGTLWQDTDGIKMIWRKDGAAWVPAVWRWSGTTAQMNAFTQAPQGFVWFNSSDNSDYFRIGGAWRRQMGAVRYLTQVTVTTSGSAGGTAPVSFPTGMFSSPPLVFLSKLTASGAKYIPYVATGTITTSGFTAGVYSGDGSTGNNSILLAVEAVQI